MAICPLCEQTVDKGILYGVVNESSNKINPICIKCLKRLLESDGNDIGLKSRLEKWLDEENFSFNLINEPAHLFHYILKNVGPLKMVIEIFQERGQAYIIIGFMTFLSRELSFKILKLGEKEKNEFKQKIDEFLASIRVDYRTGYRVGYELVNEKGHYGAKYFVKAKAVDCNKESFLKIIEMVQKTGERADSFLNSELLSLEQMELPNENLR